MRTLGGRARLVYLHRQLEQLVEHRVRLLRLLETRLDRLAQRRDLVGQVPLDGKLILARSVVLVADEQLYDVVYSRAYSGAALVYFVKVDEGLVERERAGIDELHDRCAEAVGVSNMLEPIGGLNELEVRCGRYESELTCTERKGQTLATVGTRDFR